MKYQTTMEIDLNKIRNNTYKLCEAFNNYKYKIVDLKDNGHGLGLKIIDTMADAGITMALVGSLKEGIKVRHFNKKVKLLVNYWVYTEEIYDCINNDIGITIYNKESLDKILKLDIKDNLKIHILIDNGSNLLGVRSAKELQEIVDIIDTNKYFVLEGIYTEITTLGVNDEFYYKELDNFYKLVGKYVNRDIMIHINEPAMYHEKKNFINGIKFDLAILGIEANIKDSIFNNMKIKNIEKKYGDLNLIDIDLELVFNITSEVMTIREVSKGTIIGKNYVAKNDMFVAVIPIGYKDGITSSIEYVSINNLKREILTDEIDRMVVEASKDVKIKDKVYILNEERNIYDILDLLKTNRYYLMSILNRNLTREYINEINEGEDYL